MNPFSVRFRIAAFVMTLVGFIVLAGIFSVSRAVADRVQEATKAASASVQKSLAEKIKTESDHLTTIVKLFADRPGTKNLYQAGADEVSISNHLQEVINIAKIDWAVLADSNWSVLGKSGIGNDYVSKEYGKRPFEIIGKKLYIVAQAPIQVGEYVHAHLTFGILLDQDQIRDLISDQGGQVVILRNSEPITYSIPELKSAVFSRTEGRDTFADVDYSWSKTELGSSLEVVSLIPREEILANFAPISKSLLLLLIFGLITGYFGARLLANAVSKPIENVVGASKVLEQGKWPLPIASRRQDELGVLERSFDSMVDSIRTNREKLLKMVDIDPLTELLNYRTFRRVVDERLERNEDVWIAIADIDGFENFNQEFGNDSGDQLLIDLGKIFKSHFDSEAVICRYSGNQFGICAGGESELLLQRIRRTIAEKYPITLSIGLAQLGEENRRSDLLLLSAQLAVGQAKTSGRNRVRVFDGFGDSFRDGDLSFLRQSSYAAVRALAEAVDAKDEYTRGHSQRVAEYARELAASCGYDSGYVDLVFVTGTLHDVGKIGVPDIALKKPGKLSDEEFEMIKLHPALGEKIVSQIPELADTIPGIRGHHERFDGRGYPDGLIGNDIPLLARILAVADTYDAMTSDRPYRKGLDPSVAFEAILSGRGTQFDPDLATQFVEMMSAKVVKKSA
jgi:diguanylate cyclase (GGDEF)-like protein